MKTITLQDFFLRKKALLHLMIIILSLIVTVLFSAFNKSSIFHEDQISLFLLLLIQLELFMSVARMIFKDLDPGLTRYDLTKIVLLRFGLFLVICFFIALVISIIFVCARSLIHNTEPAGAIINFFEEKFGEWLKGTVGGLLFGAAFFIFVQWQDALKREQKLREENLIFLNETLKNQINPHFLFNNLNTLSSLIGTSTEIAESFISRLSSVYRYIIENSAKEKMLLSDEMEFIKDYVYLYQVRDKDKIRLDISVKNPEIFFILPVSLQILVENAIKHNIATKNNPLNISIYTEGENIVVRNNLQKMASQIKSTGIGLKNLSERLRLFSGKKMIIEETDNSFLVKIPLLK